MRAMLTVAACVWLTGVAPARAADGPGLELVVQQGHTHDIHSVSFSPDGRHLLTGSYDGTAGVWDAISGRKLAALTGAGTLLDVASFSPDGRRAVTVWRDGTAIIQETITGRKLRNLTSKTTRIHCARFSFDGRQLVTGAGDGTASVWDVDSGRLLRTLVGHSAGVFSASFSPNGRRVLTGSDDKSAIVWDRDTGRQLYTLTGHTAEVRSASFSPDGRYILTDPTNSSAAVWDANSGQRLYSLGGDDNVVRGATFSPDGWRIITTSHGKTAVVWETNTGRRVATLTGHKDEIHSASFSPDGRHVATASADKTAIIWDVASGEMLRMLNGHTKDVLCTAFSPDGRRVLTGSKDQTACAWDADNGRRLRTFAGQGDTFADASFSPDGRRIVTASSDGNVAIWGADTGGGLLTLAGHTGEVYSASFSPDGRRVVTASDDCTAAVWDARDGRRLLSLATPEDSIRCASFSPNGRRVVTSSGQTANIWDAGSGESLRTLSGHTSTVYSASFSPDGRTILTSSVDRTVRLWDTESGQSLRPPPLVAGYIQSAAYSPDGLRVLTTRWLDDTASVWDAKSGQELFKLVGHTGGLNSASYRQDGRQIVTSAGESVRLWDGHTGRELCSLFRFDQGADWLVTTPDGLFDGSPNADRFVAYRIQGTDQFVDLSQYRKRYHRPGLLADILAGKSGAPAVPFDKALPPVVTFLSPAKPGPAASNTMEVKVRAEPRSDQPLTELRLIVDGRPFGGPKGVQRVEVQPGQSAEATWTVMLDPGKHTLKALADTSHSQGVSDQLDITYSAPARVEVELPRLYVLSVGVAAYNDESLKLNYAAKDAQQLAQVLDEHAKPLYKSVTIKTLTDKQATRSAVLQGLGWLRKEVTQRDVGVVFFSGHGEKDTDGNLYLLPVDTDTNDLLSTAVPTEQVKKTLVALPGRILLMLDACHSGGFDAPKKKNAGSLTDDLVRDLIAEENGVLVLCSSTGRESSLENNQYRMGNFALALTEGLTGKAKRTDGAIYLHNLDAYITDRVKELSNGRQHPVSDKRASVRSFPLTKP